MKNYFTDSQVKEALEKLGMRRPFSSHSLQHYKNLMNLAVETAIGSKLQDYLTILNAVDECRASIIVDGVNDSVDGGIIYTDLNDAIEAIKELEN